MFLSKLAHSFNMSCDIFTIYTLCTHERNQEHLIDNV